MGKHIMNILLTKNYATPQKNVSFNGAKNVKQNEKLCSTDNRQNLPLQKCSFTGRQIVQLHNKQKISFKGSEKHFPRHIFPVGASNEDTFDRKIAAVIKDPDRKSNLEVLIKERLGITQEQLNEALLPETLSRGTLGEIVQNGQSLLHKAALQERFETMERLQEQDRLDFEKTMARVDSKLEEEISKSTQVTQSNHHTLTERRSLSEQERNSISELARENAERAASTTKTEREGSSISRLNESTNRFSTSANTTLLIPGGSISGDETTRETITNATHSDFEQSIQGRVSESIEKGLTKAFEQSTSNQQDATRSNTLITSIVSRGINYSVGNEDIADLKIRHSDRMFQKRAASEKFRGEIESANLVYMLKMLMKAGRVQTDEVFHVLPTEPVFSRLKERGDSYASEGNHQTAALYYQNAVGERTKFLAEKNCRHTEDDFVLAGLHRKLGETKLALGEPEEAEKHYLEAARIHEKVSLTHDPAMVSQAYHDLGQLHLRGNNLPEAEKWLGKASDLVITSGKTTQDTLTGLIDAHKLTGNPAGVMKLLPAARIVLAEAEVIEHAKPLLQHEEPKIRLGTIDTLVNIGKDEAMQHLSPLLMHEDESTRHAAIEAFGKVGKPEDAELIKPLIKHENESTRTLATDTYIKLVKPLLDDGDATVRHNTIDSLLILGDKGADAVKPTKSREVNTASLSELESVSKKFPFTIQQEDELVRRSTPAIDIARTVDSFGIESLSKGLGSLFKFINFKEQHKVSNYRLSESAHTQFSQAVGEGHHEAVATLYRVWANYHRQAGETEHAVSLEQKALSILEGAAKLVKK